MWTTFTTILDYLEYFGKIHVEDNKTVTWLWNPKGIEQLEKRSVLASASNKSDNMKNNIGDIKTAILPILRKEGVSRAAIFGSTARGEAKKGSDVDLLVGFGKKRVTLFDLGGLKMDLEEKLKRKVDIVEYDSVDKRLRSAIFHEKVDIL